VLVLHDLLGIYDGISPRFAKRYATVKNDMIDGVQAYADEVRAGRFPASEHTYSIDPEELESFRSRLRGAGGQWDW
jgi:3-methyl-2-oxobutanoate hydroxymethyltransferase